MDQATQSESTETKELSVTDDEISFSDFERLRSGQKVTVQKSAPDKTGETKKDDSETSKKLEAKAKAKDDDELESDEDEASDEEVEAKPKKKSGTQRRIEKLVKQRSAVEQERDYWREQAMRANPKADDKKEESKADKGDAKEAKDGRPDANNFETYEEYIEAVAEWKADQKLSAKEKEDNERRLKETYAQKIQKHHERMDSYKKANPDFDDVVAEFAEEHGEDFQFSPAVTELVAESEDGPALLHELFKNPEELVRINGLPPLAASRAVGRIEARLEKQKAASEEKEATKTKATKAPPPAKTISASATTTKKSLDDPELSFAEYERLRREQIARKR